MTATEIILGEVFIDDRGRTAQLHGIGLQRVGDRWFAWGEDKAAGDPFTAFVGYSLRITGDRVALEWRDSWSVDELRTAAVT